MYVSVWYYIFLFFSNIETQVSSELGTTNLSVFLFLLPNEITQVFEILYFFREAKEVDDIYIYINLKILYITNAQQQPLQEA